MRTVKILRAYSDLALAGIIRQLELSGDWPQRLEAARREIERRKNLRR